MECVEKKQKIWLKVLFFVDYNLDSAYKFTHSLAVSPPHTLPPDGQGFLFFLSSIYLIVVTRRSSFLAQIKTCLK